MNKVKYDLTIGPLDHTGFGKNTSQNILRNTLIETINHRKTYTSSLFQTKIWQHTTETGYQLLATASTPGPRPVVETLKALFYKVN